ncbi:hypothetical protein N825_33705 [Skermanella stibiiresistens SB22]|uniref:Uncharacterized protein n=1 Tax=Skermanella stibiiresistens SB22 TaxID=1385369 RepID=W9H4A8_9PROT|nr:hypothetical protein N825_33705 [Skermanella stibiiresistens SB22]
MTNRADKPDQIISRMSRPRIDHRQVVARPKRSITAIDGGEFLHDPRAGQAT